MFKIKNTETYGWSAAIRGMRNPLNSWDNSDSCMSAIAMAEGWDDLGENDLELMKRLASAGNDHGKFMRMITVTCDIIAPLYWWKEFDTYKVGTVANSCSTMHKIAAKEFTEEDFSFENLSPAASPIKNTVLEVLNMARTAYLDTKDKTYWWDMIQLLPCSYNQRRTVQINYAVLKNIYNARRAHKLDEWHTLCEWIEHLPYSELITET